MNYLDQRYREVHLGRLNRQTMARDCTHIRWLQTIMGANQCHTLTTAISLLQRGLRIQHAAIGEPVSKALPLSRKAMEQLTARADKFTAVALRLAFITASRLDDVFKLTRKSFLPYQTHGIAVLWGVTKSNQTAERRVDHQQLIPHCPELLCLLRHDVLRHTSARKCLKLLQSAKPSAKYIEYYQRLNPTVRIRHHFTMHSPKRGRAEELWRDAANGKTTVQMVLHRLKHKSETSALAYAPDPVVAARAIERSKSKA